MSPFPARTDVVIIGGGFAGCATAGALLRRGPGVRVVVLEREAELGRFASGRGAGLGRQLAEDDATTELTIRGAAQLRSELAAAWSPTGGILTFDDAAHAHTYRERAARHDLAVTPLDRAGVLARWPGLDELPIAAALAVPSDGVIDIRALLALFAERATSPSSAAAGARGAEIVLDVAVTAVEPGGAGARVATSRGAIEARVVVDAAGAWAGAATGDPPLEAFTRNLFSLEVTPPRDAPYVWHLGHEELYLRADGDGVLASACDAQRAPAHDAQPDPARAAELLALFARRAPHLAVGAIRRQWACQRTFAADRRMRLGRDPQRPWLVWAAALGGHGATASPAIGEVVADAVISALEA